MLRVRWAGLATALAVAAAAAVTAGCGGGSSSSSALRLDPVAAAATKTESAGAAHMRMKMAVNAMGQRFTLQGAGAVDGTSAAMTLRLGSLPWAVASQLDHATVKERVLEHDGEYVIYVRAPALSSELPGGKVWVKLDLSKLGKSAGLDMSQALSGSQFQPTDLLSMLEAEGAKVQKVGAATIDGVSTTHYRVKVDLAKALQSKGLSSPMFKDLASKMKTVSANVWIDRDGLVRRIQVSNGLPQAGVHVSMKMDLSDYGAQVTIAAPPSSQVFDMTQLAEQGLGSTR